LIFYHHAGKSDINHSQFSPYFADEKIN